uniref:Par-6 family cell polarity regulator gamma n=1 Tax=Felis catus TaxID=9685 RepID=A0ABI7VT06_FELCA
MNRSFHKSQTLRFYDCSAVEVKSKFGAEFRRFSLDRQKPGKFEDFYNLVVHTHHISNTDVTIGYADVHGDLLPINNDDNFCKAVSSANPLLRVFIQKRATGNIRVLCGAGCRGGGARGHVLPGLRGSCVLCCLCRGSSESGRKVSSRTCPGPVAAGIGVWSKAWPAHS